MKHHSAVATFVHVCRHFGVGTACKTAWFHLRGRLVPALALAADTIDKTPPRRLSMLIDAGEHDPALVAALAAMVVDRTQRDWELCIHGRRPIDAAMTALLAQLHGSHPRIRTVLVDPVVDGTTGRRWTIEQATGQLVGLIGPSCCPTALTELVDRWPAQPDQSAMLMHLGKCSALLLRKSFYLAVFADGATLSAAAVILALAGTTAPVAYVEGPASG